MVAKILRLNGVLDVVGVTKSSIYQWIRDGKFPARVHLGPRSVGWRQAELARTAGREHRVRAPLNGRHCKNSV
jgi:prophage regulatory protein